MIKLFNRDGADLRIELGKEISPNLFIGYLVVDKEHKYCLKYLRTILGRDDEILAVDPAGGPFISVGDELNQKYKIVKIVSPNTFWINESNNN